MSNTKKYLIALVLLTLGTGTGYFFGYDVGWERAIESKGLSTGIEENAQIVRYDFADVQEASFSFEYRVHPDGYVLLDSPFLCSGRGPKDGEEGLDIFPRGQYAGDTVALIPVRSGVICPSNGEGPPTITVQRFAGPQSIEEFLENPYSNYQLGDGSAESTEVDGMPALAYNWSGLYEGQSVVTHRQVGTQNHYLYMFSVTYFTPMIKSDRISTNSLRV